MIIKKKRINSIKKYLNAITDGDYIQLAVPIKNIDVALLRDAGFPADIKTGDTILASSVGPVSKYNAEGKWITRKDLPKVSTYIMTRIWRWRQWTGYKQYEDHEEQRDVFRDCYQKELMPPPSEELTFIHNQNGAMIVSRKFKVIDAEHDAIKHTINLVLELFKECQILDKDQALLIPPRTRHVHWKLLPTGQYPWESLKPYVKDRIQSNAKEIQTVIFDRQKEILSYEPETCVVGTGGFYDYIAYIFPTEGVVVLESIKLGNAIYIFEADWKQFAKLTKAEIISQNLYTERIVHTKGWAGKLKDFFQKREKQEQA